MLENTDSQSLQQWFAQLPLEWYAELGVAIDFKFLLDIFIDKWILSTPILNNITSKNHRFWTGIKRLNHRESGFEVQYIKVKNVKRIRWQGIFRRKWNINRGTILHCYQQTLWWWNTKRVQERDLVANSINEKLKKSLWKAATERMVSISITYVGRDQTRQSLLEEFYTM